ncbi:MAG: hypothetical protein AAF483_06580, partial [Planctomycetota bacterium]
LAKSGIDTPPNIVKTLTKTLFDQYLFADYSGGGEDHHSQNNISLYRINSTTPPRKQLPEEGRARNFSRNSLTDFVLRELTHASARGSRTIFGFDHQYSWPLRLRQHARVDGVNWRTLVRELSVGNAETGLPALDIPRRYCKAFNSFSSQASFWTPLHGVANSYGIPTDRPLEDAQSRYRLTELVKPIQGESRPKPADAVGGTGEGIVGGQTICGLRQIAKMLDRSDIAWWPYDGFSIDSPSYHGKHVGVEIYPSAVREGPQISDDHDASVTCLAVHDADSAGRLRSMLHLDPPTKVRDRIRKEGWILGMDPMDIEPATKLVELRKTRSRKGEA